MDETGKVEASEQRKEALVVFACWREINMKFAAHRDTFFHPLPDSRQGDLVMLNMPGQQFRYEVDSTLVVSPSESGGGC